MPGGLTPEQKARAEIDALLEAAGWRVQDKEELNLSAGRGIAVNYESTGKQTNFADRLDPNHAPRRVFAFHSSGDAD